MFSGFDLFLGKKIFMKEYKFLEIGRILKSHGLRGELKVEHWCDSIEDFCKIKNIFLSTSDEPLNIEYMRVHKEFVLIKFAKVNDKNDAEMLRGKKLYAKKEDIPIKKGHYFIEDLKGCEVCDFEKGTKYGILKDVWNTGRNDIYTVTDNEKKEYYIPIIDGTVKEINLDKKKILINPIKGVFDEN